jgi:hypothetical protein
MAPRVPREPCGRSQAGPRRGEVDPRNEREEEKREREIFREVVEGRVQRRET